MKDKIKKADLHMSLEWKKCSKELFDNSKSREDFLDAFIWCGVHGNVSRTLTIEERKVVANKLYNNIERIEKGEFDIFCSFNFGSRQIRPTSWISKVCHIINPKKYPLIWDSVVRRTLNLSKYNWDEKCKEVINNWGNQNDIGYYENESRIWANN